jgi:hypothetical protein
MHTILWLENLKGRDHFEDLCVDGRVISEWTLVKQDGKVWAVCIWLRIRTSGGLCEHSNESSGSMRSGEFLGYLSDC